MRGLFLILLLCLIGQSVLNAHDVALPENDQQVDEVIEQVQQVLAQQTAQSQAATTYYTWKTLWGFFEGGYVLLKLAALIVLIFIVYEFIAWLAHFLPQHSSGKIPSSSSVREGALRLPVLGTDRILGPSSQESPERALPTITTHEPATSAFEFKGAARDLKLAFLELNDELFKRAADQVAYAHHIGLDPAPLPAPAAMGTDQYPRGPTQRVYLLMMELLAYAKSIGLSSSLPEHYQH